MCHKLQGPRAPACMSAWKVSAASTLPNQALSAFTSTCSGSARVTLRIAARSVSGTPRSRSITSNLPRPREAVTLAQTLPALNISDLHH